MLLNILNGVLVISGFMLTTIWEPSAWVLKRFSYLTAKRHTQICFGFTINRWQIFYLDKEN